MTLLFPNVSLEQFGFGTLFQNEKHKLLKPVLDFLTCGHLALYVFGWSKLTNELFNKVSE